MAVVASGRDQLSALAIAISGITVFLFGEMLPPFTPTSVTPTLISITNWHPSAQEAGLRLRVLNLSRDTIHSSWKYLVENLTVAEAARAADAPTRGEAEQQHYYTTLHSYYHLKSVCNEAQPEVQLDTTRKEMERLGEKARENEVSAGIARLSAEHVSTVLESADTLSAMALLHCVNATAQGIQYPSRHLLKYGGKLGYSTVQYWVKSLKSETKDLTFLVKKYNEIATARSLTVITASNKDLVAGKVGLYFAYFQHMHNAQLPKNADRFHRQRRAFEEKQLLARIAGFCLVHFQRETEAADFFKTYSSRTESLCQKLPGIYINEACFNGIKANYDLSTAQTRLTSIGAGCRCKPTSTSNDQSNPTTTQNNDDQRVVKRVLEQLKEEAEIDEAALKLKWKKIKLLEDYLALQ